MLSIASDYAAEAGNPEPNLRKIAEHGFTHLHWCHHWDSDFLYSSHEIAQIHNWLSELGLTLIDLHASKGQEKQYVSAREYERLSGVELVANRINMTADLGGDAIVLHPPKISDDPVESRSMWDSTWKSLDSLVPVAESRNIRIAFENLVAASFPIVEQIIAKYGNKYVGLCYDSGHGNIAASAGSKLENLIKLCNSIYAVHLHDNDATFDQHKIPFMGTIDWNLVMSVLANSSYKKPISMEISMKKSGYTDEDLFLNDSFAAGQKLTDMLFAKRG